MLGKTLGRKTAGPPSRLRTTHSPGRSLSGRAIPPGWRPAPALEGLEICGWDSSLDKSCAAHNWEVARPKISRTAIFPAPDNRLSEINLTPASTRSMEFPANCTSQGPRPALQVPGAARAEYTIGWRCGPDTGHRPGPKKWWKSQTCQSAPGASQSQALHRPARLQSASLLLLSYGPRVALQACEGRRPWISSGELWLPEQKDIGPAKATGLIAFLANNRVIQAGDPIIC